MTMTNTQNNVKYGKFKLSQFFTIEKVRGINKSGLTDPSTDDKYDYVTRTSQNNGVESYTGKVESRELNEPGTFSLGLLQMTFFYRDKLWYAGQFVRKIVPKQKMSREQKLYFLSIFQALRPLLLSVLVRNVDKTFNEAKVELPVTPSGTPDFEYMEERIRELEEERIRELDAYLKASGLNDTTLTDEEQAALYKMNNGGITWKKFRVGDLFEINTGSLVSKRYLNANPGNVPRISVTTVDNGVIGYFDDAVDIPNIRYYKNFISVNFFGNVFYHPDKASVEMKVHVLQLKSGKALDRKIAMFLCGALSKVFDNGTYSYGNQLSSSKLKNNAFYIALPVTSAGTIDFDFMETYITAIEKESIKGVIEYKDKVIQATKDVVNSQVQNNA